MIIFVSSNNYLSKLSIYNLFVCISLNSKCLTLLQQWIWIYSSTISFLVHWSEFVIKLDLLIVDMQENVRKKIRKPSFFSIRFHTLHHVIWVSWSSVSVAFYLTIWHAEPIFFEVSQKSQATSRDVIKTTGKEKKLALQRSTGDGVWHYP